jgi:hypothetical protein
VNQLFLVAERVEQREYSQSLGIDVVCHTVLITRSQIPGEGPRTPSSGSIANFNFVEAFGKMSSWAWYPE